MSTGLRGTTPPGTHRCAGVDAHSARRLAAYVHQSEWLLRALRVVADSTLPDAWIGAGVIRDVVWGELHGHFDPDTVNDIDVPFFDPVDLTADRDRAAQRQLTVLCDDLPWEATNQAAVHVWYHRYFGDPAVPALMTIHDAVATWPETATCVAVRFVDGELDVCAPHGLDDLLDGIWRRNPARVSAEVSSRRLERHRRRWPNICFLPP